MNLARERRSMGVFEVIAVGLLLVILTAALFCSCTRRPEDVAQIKKVYTEFRTAYLEKRYDQAATNYLSSELLSRYPDPNKFFATFFSVSDDLPPLEQDAYVKFNEPAFSRAVVFPRRRIPTIGQGLVKETNGWKIEIRGVPVVP